MTRAITPAHVIVVRHLNRALKRHLRIWTIENDISAQMAKNVAQEFENSGWIVSVENVRQRNLPGTWRFSFKEKSR